MKKEEDQGTRALHAMGHILMGAVIALAVCILCLLFASFGVSGGWIKEGLMGQLTVASCVVGTLIGGLTAVQRHRARGLVVGVAVGGCVFLMLLTIGYLFYKGVSMEQGGAALLIACLCGGALAGLLGGSRGAKGKRGARKRTPRHGR